VAGGTVLVRDLLAPPFLRLALEVERGRRRLGRVAVDSGYRGGVPLGCRLDPQT
jgi:hypothetical protein